MSTVYIVLYIYNIDCIVYLQLHVYVPHVRANPLLCASCAGETNLQSYTYHMRSCAHRTPNTKLNDIHIPAATSQTTHACIFQLGPQNCRKQTLHTPRWLHPFQNTHNECINCCRHPGRCLSPTNLCCASLFACCVCCVRRGVAMRMP